MMFLVVISMFFFPRITFAEETLLPIQISEVLPNPVGDDTQSEWIELYNPTESDVLLDGWSTSDVYGAVTTYSFTHNIISAHSFYVLERSESGITLNNDQEQVVLSSPAGQSVSTAIMITIPEGKSFSFIDGTWIWADPTKGGTNSTTLSSPSPSPTVQPSPTPSQQPTPTPSPSPSPSPTLQPSPSPTPATTVVGNIVLSEVQACSPNEHEWIELQNIGDTETALDDWRLLDAGSVIASNLENTRIPAHGFAVVELASYHLNNSGDLIQLQYGDQNKDQFAYDHCDQGKTWAKSDDGYWRDTSCVTKGEANVSCEESSIATSSPSPTPLQTLGQKSQQVTVFSPSPRPQTSPSQQAQPARSSSSVQYTLPEIKKVFVATIEGAATHSGKVLSATDKEPFHDPGSLQYIVSGLLFSVSSAYPALKQTKKLFFAWYNRQA